MISARRVVAPTMVNLGRLSWMLRAAGSAADDDIEREILHGRVENFLHRPAQPVNLVDEENIALAQVGQDGGQIAGLFNGRAGGDLEIGIHLVGQDVAERGLAQTGRTVEQHVIQRLPALACGLDQNANFVAQPLLADHLIQRARAQRVINFLVAALGLA